MAIDKVSWTDSQPTYYIPKLRPHRCGSEHRRLSPRYREARDVVKFAGSAVFDSIAVNVRAGMSDSKGSIPAVSSCSECISNMRPPIIHLRPVMSVDPVGTA